MFISITKKNQYCDIFSEFLSIMVYKGKKEMMSVKMKNKEKWIGSLILGLIFIIFFVVNHFFIQKPKSNNEDIFVPTKESIPDATEVFNDKKVKGKRLTVEIKGEVKKPEVYIMEEDSIIKDIIIEAGGITEKGDLSSINQAKKLKDGDCIVIPSVEDSNGRMMTNGGGDIKSQGRDEIININTASKEELMKLPGVGEVTAGKIIDYRESNGGFSSVEDIKNISGIGDKTLAKFKEKIDVR